jgi:hypothetical protein
MPMAFSSRRTTWPPRFYRACARAGRTPAQKHGSFGMFGAPGWEVRDEMAVF